MTLTNYQKKIVQERTKVNKIKITSSDILNELGFILHGYKIEEGKKIRVDLECPSGSSYHHVEKLDSTENNWENSHFHKSTKEIYFVEKGKILIATKRKFYRGIKVKILKSGEAIILKENEIHNMYAFPNTIYKVLKNPTKSVNPELEKAVDWYHSPDWFDIKVKNININKYL